MVVTVVGMLVSYSIPPGDNLFLDTAGGISYQLDLDPELLGQAKPMLDREVVVTGIVCRGSYGPILTVRSMTLKGQET